jgi:hypothetical protein
VQAEEARAGHEGQRHQQQAGVAVAAGRLADRDAQRHVDQRDGGDQPEVPGVVLHVHVEPWIGAQQPQAEQRQRQAGQEQVDRFIGRAAPPGSASRVHEDTAAHGPLPPTIDVSPRCRASGHPREVTRWVARGCKGH